MLQQWSILSHLGVSMVFSYAFKLIASSILSYIVCRFFINFMLNSYSEWFAAFSIFVCIFFFIFTTIKYFIDQFKREKPPTGFVVQGIEYFYDPRTNETITMDVAKGNPALIMYDLMIRQDKRVRQDPYVRDMVCKMANYCDKRIDNTHKHMKYIG